MTIADDQQASTGDLITCTRTDQSVEAGELRLAPLKFISAANVQRRRRTVRAMADALRVMLQRAKDAHAAKEVTQGQRQAAQAAQAVGEALDAAAAQAGHTATRPRAARPDGHLRNESGRAGPHAVRRAGPSRGAAVGSPAGITRIR